MIFRNTVRNFASIVEPFSKEIKWSLGKAYNGPFQAADAELYYCVIRTWKPLLIIEVGTGNSAWIASEALKKNGQGRLVAIDPRPRTRLPPGTLHIKSAVQNVPLETFSRLGAKDILFIDSSHTTGEAQYHCQRILPFLKSGVLVHFHDVAYPFEKYYHNDRGAYAEPDVILEFLANRSNFEVITSNSHVYHTSPSLLRSLVKSNWFDPFALPTSLWLRKRG